MIQVSQIFACNKVELPCELYYICELGKYLRIKYGHSVSLNGVILSNSLKKCLPIWTYFRVAAYNGWVSEYGNLGNDFDITDTSTLICDTMAIRNYFMQTEPVQVDVADRRRRDSDLFYDFSTPRKMEVSFESQTNERWVWSMSGSSPAGASKNNSTFNQNRSDQAWLSLCAMVAVERLINRKPQSLLVKVSDAVVHQQLSLSYIMILDDKTPCFTGWCDFQYQDESVPQSKRLHLGYIAWYVLGRDMGLCSTRGSAYLPDEKLREIRNLDWHEGSLCLYYEREHGQKRDYIKSIRSCRVAKITGISRTEITFDVINTVRPYYHSKARYRNMTVGQRALFNNKLPYENLNVSHYSSYLTDIGIRYYLFDETAFLAPMTDSDDLAEVLVERDGQENRILLNQNELTYWILEDYQYEYDKKQFLKECFGNEMPLRDKYYAGLPIDPSILLN